MEHKRLKIHQHYTCNNILICKLMASFINSSNSLEIGAGKGVITKWSEYKIDVAQIITEFHSLVYPYTNKIYRDFLKIPINELYRYELIIGNLPYKLSSEIIFRCSKTKVPVLYFMLQYEYGKKLLSTKLSRLKILVENFYNISYITLVTKDNFSPIPPVDGIILKFERKDEQFDELKLKTLSNIFCYPNKTLKNIYKLCNQKLNLYENKRIAELTKEEFKIIYYSWQ
jgi:16S rRNA A1518/A1519 N6-dimethyltransferase RsmA/KsgA/DIM1 with predicted DNA glycosylase/AP lyase activity